MAVAFTVIVAKWGTHAMERVIPHVERRVRLGESQFALSMSLLFLKFRRRFRRLFGKRSDSADDLDDDFDDESSDAGLRADHVENSFRAETDKGEPSRSDPTPVKSSRRNTSEGRLNLSWRLPLRAHANATSPSG